MTRRINPEHIRIILELANASPFIQFIGMKITEIGEGTSRMEVPVRRNLTNSMGSIHGGAYATMLDALTYWAVYCGVEEGDGLITVDLNVHDLSTVRDAHDACVYGFGRAIRTGRTLCISEGRIEDEHGRILAFGTSTIMVLQGRGTVAGSLERLGITDLPKKFLEG